MSAIYTVVVGNIGQTTNTTTEAVARKDFNYWRLASQQGKGRAAGEPVTLFKDNVVMLEYEPEDRTGEDEMFHPNDKD